MTKQLMKQVTLVVSLAFLGVLLCAPGARAEFGFEEFDVTFHDSDGAPSMQAGSHPFGWTTQFRMNVIDDPLKSGSIFPDEMTRELSFDFPPGVLAVPKALPKCAASDFLDVTAGRSACPASTQFGTVGVLISFGSIPAGTKLSSSFLKVFNLRPPPGVTVKLGFIVAGQPITIDAGIRPTPPYNGFARVATIPQITNFYESTLTAWGNPASPAHDAERGEDVNIPETPQVLLPSSCDGPRTSTVRGVSWQNPGAWTDPSRWAAAAATTHDDSIPPEPLGFTGCSRLGFAPGIDAEATADSAESGTGFDISVDFDDDGLRNPDGIAQSTIEKAVVTLPRGVTVNPSVGEGLGACTPEDYERELLRSAPGEGCPNASKLGSLHVVSPLVEEAVDGSVYLAQQDDPRTARRGAENPFDSLIALYLVLRNTKLGVLVKQPLKVEPDPATGQLVSTLEDIPQLPFSHFSFHFREGQRAPLVTPSACGTYTTEAEFYPWSDPDNPRRVTSSFRITSGVGGGPCPPGGIAPFDPHFEAGSVNNNAGSFSPFVMRLIRNDGEQDMTKFSSVLPPGVLGSLKGVAKCSPTAVAIARAKTGREELASPSCPASSLIGHTNAGAGVGGALTYVGGQIYLGGPYRGAPLSVISITPAVAGPFDAGTVVVQLGLTLNPKTAEVEVDGDASDPIPHILKGIVLKVRDLRVYVDRPTFTLNPTSCNESSARARIFGSFLDVFDPADDRPVDLATRYQAANCLNLGFRPRLKIWLKGGTRRGAHPGLRAVYRPRPGDANAQRAVVTLPRSAFLDQAHIRTICTRVQFAANSCPKAARYGYARAFTPLLDEPLQGPIYLRSSNNNLPDFVADLRGLVDIEISARIDSKNGGIRSTFTSIPDAPVDRFVVRLQGGKKGVIVNSRNLCRGKARVNARFDAHNGRVARLRPVLHATGCKKRRGAKRSSHSRARQVASARTRR